MNLLQTRFEKLLHKEFSPPKLITDAIARKAKTLGIILSERQKAKIRRQIARGGRSTIRLRTQDKIDLKGRDKIGLTERDIRDIKQRIGHVVERLPDIVETVSDEVASLLLPTLKKNWPREARAQKRTLGGFQKRLLQRWRRPISLLEMLLTIALEVGGAINEESRGLSEKKHRHLTEALTRLHARACQVTSEVIILLKSGFADGAIARWRTLHEIAATASFINQHGESVAERYLKHDAIESFKAAQEYQKHCLALGYEPLEKKRAQAARTVATTANCEIRQGIRRNLRMGSGGSG